MTLEGRVNRLEGAFPATVTAEAFFTELAKMQTYDDKRISAFSRHMSDTELEKAIAEVNRMIAERDR